MPPSEEAQDTFQQWRIYLIKTLDKLSEDVDALKSLTHDRTEYLRRFDVVEKELGEVRQRVSTLDVSTAVSGAKLAVYTGLAAFVGSVVTALAVKLL